MHRYEYELSNGAKRVIETPARYAEAKKMALYHAHEAGCNVVSFRQVF